MSWYVCSSSALACQHFRRNQFNTDHSFHWPYNFFKYQLESVWLGSKGSVMPNRPSCDLCMAGHAPLSRLGLRGGQRKGRRGGGAVVRSYRCWWFWFWKFRWQEASQTKDSKEAQAIFLQRKCQDNFVEQWVFGWGAQILAMQNWFMLLM